MKRVTVALALALLPAIASAIRPATKEEVAEIQNHIDRANFIDSEISATKEILRSSPESEMQIQGEIASLEKQKFLERDKAIHLTLRAYDLVPTDPSNRAVMPTGVLVHQGFIGKRASWIPFADATQDRPLQLPLGGQITPKTDLADVAVTSADGVTVVRGIAFVSPGILALVLLHERTHFEQYTTQGIGDRFTPAELEVPAYEEQLFNMNKVGLSPTDLHRFDVYLNGGIDERGYYQKGQLEIWRDNLLEERRGKRMVAPWSAGASDTASAAHNDEDLSTLQSGFDDLDATVAEEISAAKRAAIRQQMARAYHPAPAVALEHPAAKLGRLVRMACGYPPTLTQEAVDREFPDGTIPREYFMDCNHAGDVFSTVGCTREVFRLVCKQSGDPVPVDSATLTRFAKAVRIPPASEMRWVPPPQPAAPPVAAPVPAPAPEPAPDPGEREGREKPDDGCFVSGGVRGCPKN